VVTVKFRKKPVVIDAVQLTWQTWSEVCEFLEGGDVDILGVWVDPKTGKIAKDISDSTGPLAHVAPDDAEIGCLIPTLEGEMLARQNDWIIRGVKGEVYPCKPDIFEATYEAVT
jgi:hypothetical protein